MSASSPFYCHGRHHGQSPVRLGNLPVGSTAILECPDRICRRLYRCTVALNPDEQGEHGTCQRYVGRRRLTTCADVVA